MLAKLMLRPRRTALQIYARLATTDAEKAGSGI